MSPGEKHPTKKQSAMSHSLTQQKSHSYVKLNINVPYRRPRAAIPPIAINHSITIFNASLGPSMNAILPTVRL